MTRFGIVVSTLFVLGLASACAPNTVSVTSQVEPAYDFNNFTAYHQNRDTKVEIQGSTFGADAQSFARAVTESMRGQNGGGPTNFTTSPGASAEKNLKVVLAFNATLSPTRICDDGTLAAASGDGTTLQAAWCFGDRIDSYVVARADAISGVNDPVFRNLVAEATRELFPAHNEEDTIRDNGGSDFPM
ncbi:MAG: hypothetical protein AB7P12_08275 [Alphaproteobacteria bacterium]